MESMNTSDSGKDPQPEAPVEPDPFSCCGNGCGEACVWTIYSRARKRYEIQLQEWQARQPAV